MAMLYIILMHISCFMFFANDLLSVVYFICILDYGNDVRQKANSSDFYFFLVQIGHKRSGENWQHQQCIWPRNC